jgi:hypothetical protein
MHGRAHADGLFPPFLDINGKHVPTCKQCRPKDDQHFRRIAAAQCHPRLDGRPFWEIVAKNRGKPKGFALKLAACPRPARSAAYKEVFPRLREQFRQNRSDVSSARVHGID